MSAPRITILGATGRLGQMMMSGLAERRDLEVIGQSRKPHTAYLHWNPEDGADTLQSNLVGTAALLNLIGTTPTGAAREDDFAKVNRDLAIDVLGAARNAGVPRILMASSAAVYGRPTVADQLFKETDTLAPLSAYGRSKAALEQALGQQAGSDLTTLRIGNVAGADALLGQFTAQTKAIDITLDQFTDGSGPQRSYIGPKGLADVIGAIALAPQQLPACLNIIAPPPIGMEDLLTSLDRAHPGSMQLNWRPAPENAIAKVGLCHERLAAEIGDVLRPVTSQTLVDEYLEHMSR
ncbi:MAG: NAD-dependent epimerase/dehydratase family protein [Paracoccaceae bacterium]